MIAVSLQVLLPAFWQERIEVGTRMQARMHIAVDDAQAALGGRFLVSQRAVNDVAHAILLDITRRGLAAERFRADYRRTSGKRCWRADAAVSRRRRRIA